MNWSSAATAVALLAVVCGCGPASAGKPAEGATNGASDAPKRPTRTLQLAETGTDIRGRLAPEIIKRILRAHFVELRTCYEEGLKREPSLTGIVSVTFVIDTTGAVERARVNDTSTLPDERVSSCALAVYEKLTFPEPELGKVLVTYPIRFSMAAD